MDEKKLEEIRQRIAGKHQAPLKMPEYIFPTAHRMSAREMILCQAAAYRQRAAALEALANGLGELTEEADRALWELAINSKAW